MARPRSHLLDVYDCWLHVATTEQDWAKLAKRYGLADLDSTGVCVLFVDSTKANQPHVALYIEAEATERRRVDLVTHEATHAAAQILDHIGQRADRHDSEALAYLAGFIAGWLWEATA
jgi:hypothetical protein